MVFLQLVFTFDRADAADGLGKGLRDLIDAVEELTRKEGMYHRFKYLNFSAWFQDPIGSYGKDQRWKLRHVARIYDRSGMFQRHLAGEFKLW